MDAKRNKTPFHLSFMGGPTIVGRGNYASQAFPSYLSQLLTDPFSKLGVDLIVRNAALGDGTSSFPYGWCMDAFAGEDADLISWESAMNGRGGGGVSLQGFEAFVRNGACMNKRPMLVVYEHSSLAESALQRRDLIQKYVDHGTLQDPIIITIDDIITPFQSIANEDLPPGLQNWTDLGAPVGAQEINRNNLPQNQHALIGWILSMHFLAAMELVAAYHLGADPGGTMFRIKGMEYYGENDRHATHNHAHLLPPPLSINSSVYDDALFPTMVVSSLFGTPIPHDSKDHHDDITEVEPEEEILDEEAPSETNRTHVANFTSTSTSTPPSHQYQSYTLNRLHCHTTFDPIVSHSLTDIIISGNAAEDVNLLFPRGPMTYNKAWAMDLGVAEKKREQRLKAFQLEYVDRRKAYYGVQASGPLAFFIPFLKTMSISTSHKIHVERDRFWIRNVSEEEVEALQEEIEEENDEMKEENEEPIVEEEVGEQIQKSDPLENSSTDAGDNTHDNSTTMSATKLFRKIIVCEVNEHRGQKQCNMEDDLQFIVGGKRAKAYYINAVGVSYLSRKHCVAIEIPPDSTLTTRKQMEKEAEDILGIDSNANGINGLSLLDKNGKMMMDDATQEYVEEEEAFGISLEVSVTRSSLRWNDGPCSVSHVLWEEIDKV